MGDQLERAVQVVGELREVLTEGRQLLKDLRHAERDLRKLVDEASAKAVEVADQHLEEQVNAKVEDGLAEIGREMKRALDHAVEHVDRQIADYTNLARFGNTQGRGEDVFQELARRTHQARRQLLDLNGEGRHG